MFRYTHEEKYEESTRFLGVFFVKIGISPDVLTFLCIPISFMALYELANRQFLLGVVFILLVGLLDVLDGATARAAGSATNFGTVVDHVVDRYTEFLIFSGVLLSGKTHPIWVLFAFSGMMMASYVRAKVESSGVLEKCRVGLVGRVEKLGLLVVGLVLDAFSLPIPVLTISLVVIGLLSHITALQRFLYAYRSHV